MPTSLANDGFASPQSSLTLRGKRRSLPASVPFGVVIDPALCLGAPRSLWHSGVGELAASSGDRLPEVRALIDHDPRLQGCFQR